MELRRLKKSDYKTLAEQANNPKIAENLTDMFPHPYTEEDAKKFLEESADNSEYRAITYENKFAGVISATKGGKNEEHEAGLGYWLGEEFWGKGIMTKAVSEFVDEYLKENPDIIRLQAKVYPHNLGSARVLEKTGFKYEGTRRTGTKQRGRYLDELVYSYIRN